ncbi:MAG TPA: phage tail tape measure protein [Clostridia bacterium]|nr:phage tail tape measure protein [Clostridia bacterium]
MAINLGDAILNFRADLTQMNVAFDEAAASAGKLGPAQAKVDAVGAALDHVAASSGQAGAAMRASSEYGEQLYAAQLKVAQATNEHDRAQKELRSALFANRATAGESETATARLAAAQWNENRSARAVADATEELTRVKKLASGETARLALAEREAAAAALLQQQQLERNARAQAEVSAVVRRMREETALLHQQTRTGSAEAAGESNRFGAALGGVAVRVSTLVQGFALFKAAQILREAAGAALEFENAFAEVSTIVATRTPQGVAQLAQLKREILDLPPMLGDATDLTHGLYEALSSGVAPANAVRFVGESALFARASLTDTRTAVDVMTTVLAAYGREAKDAGNISAALFETINLGKTRGPELAGSLGRVVPIAASLKVSLSEVLAAVATLTLAGLSTDEAMTALRGSMTALLSPTGEAEKMAKELGIDLRQMREELKDKGLAAVMGEMAQKTNGATEATAALFGNVRALNGVLTLTGPQAHQYQEILKRVTEAEREGTAAHDAANKMLASQGSQLEVLGRTFKTEFIKAWEDGKPVIDTAVQAFRMMALDSGALKVVLGALGITAAALATVFQSFVLVFNGIGWAVNGLVASLISAAGHIPILRKYVNESTDSFKLFQASANDYKEGATNAAVAIVNINNAVKTLVTGTRESTAATKDNTSATNDKSAADRAAAEAAAEHARAEQDKKLKAAEAAKAMRDYASAHGIHLVGELKKSAEAATAFYELLVRQKAPMSEQNTAWINMSKAVGEYRKAVTETRNELERLHDLAVQQRGGPQVTPSKIDNTIDLSPEAKALEQLSEGLKALGIQGSAVWAGQVQAAQEAFDKIKESGLSTYADLRQAQMKLLQAKLGQALAFGQTSEAKRYKDEIEDIRKELEKLGITTDQTTKKTERFGHTYNDVGSQLDKFAQKLRADRGELTKTEQAFDSILLGATGALGNAVSQWVLGEESLGIALRKGMAAEAATIAGKAAMWGAYYTAWGIADLFWNPARAGADFAAAAQFFAVAALAGSFAYAIKPESQRGERGAPDSAQPIETAGDAAKAEASPIQTQNIQHFATGGLVSRRTLAVLGDSVGGGNATEAAIPLDDPRAVAKIVQALGGGGGTTNHYHIAGVISDDNLHKVIKKIDRKVNKGGVPLTSSNARRVTRRG